MSNDSVISIPSSKELLFSLPVQFQTVEVIDQLQKSYDREVEIINEYVARLKAEQKSYSAVMYTFRQSGSQFIAEFAVKDLTLPKTNSYNFHCQNVSQWVYAGCILFDERSFQNGSEVLISTHH